MGLGSGAARFLVVRVLLFRPALRSCADRLRCPVCVDGRWSCFQFWTACTVFLEFCI